MLQTRAATPPRPENYGDDPDEDLDFDWRPEPLQRAVDSDRTFRWPIVLGALFIGVSVALTLRLFVFVPTDSAGSRLDDFRTAATELDGALTAVIEAPWGDPTALAELDAAIASAREALEEPETSDSAVSDAQQTLTVIVDDASLLASRGTMASTYREQAGVIFGVPTLPSDAPAELVDQAERALNDYRVAAIAALARLGDYPALADFRALAEEFVDELPGWSDRYLLALSRGQVEAAAALLADIHARAAIAEEELADALEGIEVEGRAAATSLRDTLRGTGLVDLS